MSEEVTSAYPDDGVEGQVLLPLQGLQQLPDSGVVAGEEGVEAVVEGFQRVGSPR